MRWERVFWGTEYERKDKGKLREYLFYDVYVNLVCYAILTITIRKYFHLIEDKAKVWTD